MATTRVTFRNEYDIKISRKFYRYFNLRRSYLMYFIMAMGALCLVLLLFNTVNIKENQFQFIMFLSIAMIGLVFMPFYTFINIMTSASKDKKKRGNQIELYEISKEKITRGVEGLNKKFVVNWMTISSVVETSEAFYFFTTEEEAFIIAKSGLQEGTFESLRHMIYTYMPKNKKGVVEFIIKDKEVKKELKEKKKLEKKAK